MTKTFSVQKLSLATAPVSDCDHFWDSQNPLSLSLYKRPLRLGSEEIGQTVVKEFLQDKLMKKYVKFYVSVKQQKLAFETLDSNKSRQGPLDHKACCSCRRICAIFLDNHLERELFPMSLSIATPNGRLRKPLAKFDLSKMLQEDKCQSQSTISKVAFTPILAFQYKMQYQTKLEK